MKFYQQQLLALIALFIVAVSITPSATATRTIGIGPSVIEFPDVFRFGEYQRTIFIYNGNDYESNFSLHVSGDITDWITFYETIDSIDPITSKIVAPETTAPIIIQLSIPKNASNGAYAGEIYTEFYPTNVTQENVTAAGVIIRLPAIVNIYVSGTQNLNATVSRITFMETEINYILPVAIDIKNTGNVVATPSVNITITKEGLFVDRYAGNLASIQPGAIKYNTIHWNTTGNIPGTYDANVTINLGEKTLLNNHYSFNLLAPGTLTRNGTLSNLTISGTPTKNGIIKIEASFSNTGEIETKAKFIGEVYRDGKLIHTIESEELLVSRYSNCVLTTYYRLGSESGIYSIKGYVLYEGKQTNIESISLSIGTFSYESLLLYSAIVGIIISMILISIVVVKKKKASGTSAQRLKNKTSKPIKIKQKNSRKTTTPATKNYNQKRTASKTYEIEEMNTKEIAQFLDSFEIPNSSRIKANKRTSKK